MYDTRDGFLQEHRSQEDGASDNQSHDPPAERVHRISAARQQILLTGTSDFTGRCDLHV